MRFGKLDINPARNPAILDTATWDPARAWSAVDALPPLYWPSLRDAAQNGNPLPVQEGFTPYAGSHARWRGSDFLLAQLADGQQLLLELGKGQGTAGLGQPIGSLALADTERVLAYPADLATVAQFVRVIHPERGPQPLGDLPRLGIGNRMTTAVWPAIYQAMARGGFAANAIQNSMRELNLLDDLLAGRPPERNYAPNFGTIQSGHTGSSFEGLWLYGVLAALQAEEPPRYGADADHVQVKREPDQLLRTQRALDAARHYTFYTLDVSDVLDYAAMQASPAAVAAALDAKIPQGNQRKAVLAYHQQPLQMAGTALQADDLTLERLVVKYWDGFDAIQRLTDHIRQLKQGQPFDLEFAIDEVPAGVRACDAITSHAELLFVLREARRREIPLTHVACNFGIEKEVDYRCPDGLTGLARRVQLQTDLARSFGVMLDFHSGDDLTQATRRTLGRATRGHNHFKVSPSLQTMFAATLSEVHPERFQPWWGETLAYARREAKAGSPLAAAGIRALEAAADRSPSAHHAVFHHYGFAFVGRRDAQGQYLHRESLYGLSPEFYRTYHERVMEFLCLLAQELFQPEP